MARKTRQPPPPAYDKSEVEKVLNQFRTHKHFMQGGDGACAFIYINRSIYSSENCIKILGLERALMAVPGVREAYANLD